MKRPFQMTVEDAWGKRWRRGRYATRQSAAKAAKAILPPNRSNRKVMVTDVRSGKTTTYR